MAGLSQLGALNLGHDASAFDCGVESQNVWLTEHAVQAQLAGTSRTFVYTAGNSVIAYYALTAGSVERDMASSRIKRNTGPHAVPVIVLARLAVDVNAQGRGLGKFLLQDALERVILVSAQIGVRAVVVDPVNDDASRFYRAMGFSELKAGHPRLCLLIDDLVRAQKPKRDPANQPRRED